MGKGDDGTGEQAQLNGTYQADNNNQQGDGGQGYLEIPFRFFHVHENNHLERYRRRTVFRAEAGCPAGRYEHESVCA